MYCRLMASQNRHGPWDLEWPKFYSQIGN